MAGITNWVNQKKIEDRSNDHKALKKAKKIEQQLEKMGWRWYRLSERLEVFIPCDKDGNPTELGLKKIERQKILNGIK